MLILTFISIANGQESYKTYVDENKIIISADKPVYYCEPVFKDGKCLVKIGFYVENVEDAEKPITIVTEFEQKAENVFIEKYTDVTDSKAYKETPIDAKEPTKTTEQMIKPLEKKYYVIDVWASESGKFNLVVDLGFAKTILDPFINVSINATYPSWYLLNGTNMGSNVDAYASRIDITSGLTDDSTATSYYTSEGQFYTPISTIVEGWSFNDIITGSGTIKGFLGRVDGTIIGSLETAQTTARYSDYGATCDGTNDYITFPHNNALNFGSGDMTMAVIFNTSYNIVASSGILNKRANPLNGYQMWYMSDETINCVWSGVNTRTLSSTLKMNDGKIHIIVCKKEGNNMTMWVDGMFHQQGTTNVGDMNNSVSLYACSQDSGASRWQGTLWEAGVMNIAISDEIIRAVGNQTGGNNVSLVNRSKGTAISAYFNHSIDALENYSLYVKSSTSGLSVIRVQRYVNMTEVNKTKFQDYVITSGDNFLSLVNLLYIGYNFPLRIWSLTGTNDSHISEVLLYETISDNQPPSIKNVQINDTTLTCDDSFRVSANITDNQVISNAVLRLSYQNNFFEIHTMNHNGLYYYDVSSASLDSNMVSAGYPFDNSVWNISLIQINATDIVGNINSTNYTFGVMNAQYSCCHEDWVQDSPTCLINDTFLITYTDANACGTYNGVPVNNGTEDYCNYCSEDLVQTLGNCLSNSTQSVSYTDNNYYTCCDVTGLDNDCSILNLYPYNETTSQFCQFFSNDMGVPQCSAEFDFSINEKEYCVVYIPYEYVNESFKCIDHIEDSAGKIVQSNPEYRERTDALIDLRQDPETRQYFTPANSIVNFYITKKNLIPDEDYYLHIECSSPQRLLQSVHTFQVGYQNLDEVFFRTQWLMANSGYLFAGILVIFILLLVIVFFWKNIK